MLDRFTALPIGTQILCIIIFAAVVSITVVNLVVHRKEIVCKLGYHKLRLELSEYVSFNFRNTYSKCEHCGMIEKDQIHHDMVYPFKTADEFEVREYKKRNWLK